VKSKIVNDDQDYVHFEKKGQDQGQDIDLMGIEDMGNGWLKVHLDGFKYPIMINKKTGQNKKGTITIRELIDYSPTKKKVESVDVEGEGWTKQTISPVHADAFDVEGAFVKDFEQSKYPNVDFFVAYHDGNFHIYEKSTQMPIGIKGESRLEVYKKFIGLKQPESVVLEKIDNLSPSKPKEPDYSSLTKTETKWMQKFEQDRINLKPFTEATKRKYLKLKNKMSKPKPPRKLSQKQQNIKDQAELRIGDSEDAKNKRVLDAFNEKDPDAQYKGMSKEEMDEFEAQTREPIPDKPDAKTQKKIDEANKSFDEKFEERQKKDLKETEESNKKALEEAEAEYKSALEENGAISERIDEYQQKMSDDSGSVENPNLKDITLTSSEASAIGIIPKALKGLMDFLNISHGDVKINIVNSGQLLHPQTMKPSKGYYDYVTGEIYIDGKAFAEDPRLTHTIAHEMVHAKTWDAVRNNPVMKAELESLLAQAQKAFPNDEGHWTSSIDEFLAEGLSNPEVINKMKGIKVDNTAVSLWDKFKEFIYKALGVNPHTNIHAELERMLGNIDGQSYTTAKGAKFKEFELKTRAQFSKAWNSFRDSETYNNARSDISNDTSSEYIRDLQKIRRKAMDTSARTSRGVKDALHELTDDVFGSNKNPIKVAKRAFNKRGIKRREQIYTHVLETDYASINRFKTKAEAEEFMKANSELYHKVGKYVDQTARGMRDSGQMNNKYYTNNGYQIATRAGIDPNAYGDLIDDMISIRAMDNADWKFVKENMDEDWFKAHIQIAQDVSAQSKALFSKNPWDRVKGYQAEIYDTPYNYVDTYVGPIKEYKGMTRDEIGEKASFLKVEDFETTRILDTDPSYIEGMLPVNIEKNLKGEQFDIPDEMMNDIEAIEAYADRFNLGLRIDKAGNPKKFRKVTPESQKVKMNKRKDGSDVLAQTYQNNVRKAIQRDLGIPEVFRILADEKNGLILGKKANGDPAFKSAEEADKAGFVELTPEQRNALPTELRNGNVTHIAKKY
ncbi:hypothetical protein DRQ29_05430, partial [bacterium]